MSVSFHLPLQLGPLFGEIVYNSPLQIVGRGVGRRTWSGGKPSSHKLTPTGVSSGLFFVYLEFSQY